jgi:hypothetical protein
VRNFPSADRAVDAGADPADAARAMTAAAYEATFNTLFLLTSEEDIQALWKKNDALISDGLGPK